ncbi:hypothetical protein TNCV_3616921 [Trichonephila clavipes]|nr:hypothetical protein TNCV_3616921 [Trichonephila clavipes]
MLEKVIENWTSRLDYIRASRGSPMPEIIFKMNVRPVDIHLQVVKACGENAMSDRMVILSSQQFNDGCTNVLGITIVNDCLV